MGGCCSDSSSDHTPLKEVKQSKDRSCTDILFLVLFLVFWGGTIAVLSWAKADGASPDRILRGMDLRGNVCGQGVHATRPYAAWPWPSVYEAQICLSDCKETQTDPQMSLKVASTPFLHWCIPTINQSLSLSVKFSGNFDAEVGTRSLADIWTVYPIILSSAAVAVLLLLVYTQLVKYFGRCLVWSCLVLTVIAAAFVGYILLQSAANADSTVSANRAKALRIAGGVSLGISVVLMLVIFALRDRIELAIRVVQESTNVIEDIKTLLLFPIVLIAIAVVYILFWAFTAIYILSVGDRLTKATPSEVLVNPLTREKTTNPATMVYYKFNEEYKNWLIAHFFGLLWNTQFLIYFGYMVVAATAADWYFSITDENGNKVRGTGPGELGYLPLWESICRILRFHLGSLALGSFIIAIINFTRAVLYYIQKHAKSENGNILQRALFGCAQCLLKCLECCIDKISKNAFVWISIWGDSFCVSACSSFGLVWRNLARVAAINIVGEYLLNIGKFLVSLLTAGIYGWIFLKRTDISSPLMPCVMVFILSYVVSSGFMIVFETIIDTTFLCFLVDCEHNATDGRLMAPPGLKSLVDDHARESESEAKKQYQLRAGSTGTQDYQQIKDK